MTTIIMKFFIFLVLFIITSCKRHDATYIYYTYNGDTLTRIDKFGETYFYHSYCNENTKNYPVSYIKSEHPRGDDLMDAYIVFKNKKINVIRIGDYFKKFGNDSSLNLIEFKSNPEFIDWEDSIHKNFHNVVRIDLVLSVEKNYNNEHNSEVIAKY